jgi:hypothetical protein
MTADLFASFSGLLNLVSGLFPGTPYAHRQGQPVRMSERIAPAAALQTAG